MAEALEQTNGAAVQDWKASLASDPEIAPHLSNISEKDLPTFVKSHLNLQKKFGDAENRVKQELAAKGMLRQAPDKYEIKRPDNLPEGAWNEGLESKFAETLKKHGASQELAGELLQLYHEGFGAFAEPIIKGREEAERAFVARAKAENKDPVEVAEGARRWMNQNIKDENLREKLYQAGLMDDYDIIHFAYQLTKDAGGFDTRNDGGSSAMLDEAARAIVAEAEDIEKNPQNPRNKLYTSGDPATVEHVNSLYKRAYGDKEVIANEFLPKIIDRT